MSQIAYVSYRRVSTDRQGKSGLGLEAQQKAVLDFLKSSQGILLAEFTEIETGRRKDRPQLQAALELCRRSRASLVIAKLDRLARNVAFISALLESKVTFTALDMLDADRTFLQMAAVFAEWEARKIAVCRVFPLPPTRARLALALLLHTGQRRSDVIQMGRQNIRHGRIALRQQKTRISLEIPIHPELARIIAATPTDNLTFLVTKGGKPFTAAGFGNWFREVCEKAGLPKHCSAHGLRKAAARRLAEARCTPHQIAAITGHKSLREIERYTAAASQLMLADEAVRALSGSKSEQNLANPDERLAKTESK